MAASILEAVPRCLLGIEDPCPLTGRCGDSREDCATRHLLPLLDSALTGDPGAARPATGGVGLPVPATGPPVEAQLTAAAWDGFYRALESSGRPHVSSYVLAAATAAFAPAPLVSSVLRRFGPRSATPLAHADVLACRHLMASTVSEVAAIREAIPGLRFRAVMGKPYSANRLAMLELARRGMPVHAESCRIGDLAQQPLGSYATRHRNSARAVVQAYVEQRPDPSRPLLVLDDGGALIDAVGQRVLNGDLTSPVVAIEQTTHGLFAARKFLSAPETRRHGFALVSVSESRTKLTVESDLIAASVVEKTDSWLALLQASGRLRQPPTRVGVVGFGIVGMSIARRLTARGTPVTAFDRNPRKAAVANQLGCATAWSLAELLRECDVVVGASGGTSINENAARQLRPGAVLVSASSGDLEFSGLSGWEMSVQPLLPADKSLTEFDHAHGLIVAKRPADDRVVYVPNRGFPVNFDGSLDPIASVDIQLTRALMLGAVLQAAGGDRIGQPSLVGRRGEFPLDDTVDRYVHDGFAETRGTGP